MDSLRHLLSLSFATTNPSDSSLSHIMTDEGGDRSYHRKIECEIYPPEPFQIVLPKLHDLDIIAFQLPLKNRYNSSFTSEIDKVNQHVAFVGLILTSLTLPPKATHMNPPDTKYVWISKTERKNIILNKGTTNKGGCDDNGNSLDFTSSSLYELRSLVKYLTKHTNISLSFYKLACNPLKLPNSFEEYCKVIDIYKDIKSKEEGVFSSFINFLLGLPLCVPLGGNQVNEVKVDFGHYEYYGQSSDLSDSFTPEFLFTHDAVNTMYNKLGLTFGTAFTNKLNCPSQSSLFSACYPLLVNDEEKVNPVINI